MTDDRILEQARTTLNLEAQAIGAAAERVNASFCGAVNLLLEMKGYAVVCGMGKSGAVARKLASTLASTGTPAFFMHPAEAVHGDLGMVVAGSVVIMLSNSGESDEIMAIIPEIKRRGVPIIAITGNHNSALSREATVTLSAQVAREACPLNLAPTASSIVQMAVGDALAMATMSSRGFTADDFAASHPAGALGRRLLIRVGDLMHSGADNPIVGLDATVEDALLVMTQATIRGAVSVVDDAGVLRGIFTDGMLRVLMQTVEDRNQMARQTMREVMTPNPTTCTPEMLAAEAAHIVQQHEYDNLPVVDAEGRAIGMLDVQDLFRAGLV